MRLGDVHIANKNVSMYSMHIADCMCLLLLFVQFCCSEALRLANGVRSQKNFLARMLVLPQSPAVGHEALEQLPGKDTI